MFDLKPDFDKSLQRIEAFWERELIDRPVVQFGLAKPPDEQVPYPLPLRRDSRERWISNIRLRPSRIMALTESPNGLAFTMRLHYAQSDQWVSSGTGGEFFQKSNDSSAAILCGRSGRRRGYPRILQFRVLFIRRQR